MTEAVAEAETEAAIATKPADLLAEDHLAEVLVDETLLPRSRKPIVYSLETCLSTHHGKI